MREMDEVLNGVEYDVLARHGTELDATARAVGRSSEDDTAELSPRANVRETAIV